AFNEGMAPPMKKLRIIRVPDQNPDALTKDEINRLLEEARKLKGYFLGTKIPRALYCESLYNAQYDTALRLGDLRKLLITNSRPNGSVTVVQKKTGYKHRVQFRPETLALMRKLARGRREEPIWGTVSRRYFFTWQRKLFKAAGLNGS